MANSIHLQLISQAKTEARELKNRTEAIFTFEFIRGEFRQKVDDRNE